MILSDRLESIISLVSKGKNIADIGCDHGFIAIELVRRRICPKVIASDLREGPLEKARINVKNAGLEDSITFRVSDGFEGYDAGEVQSAVIAGMGGMLIRDILTKGLDKVSCMDDLIVQPQSNIPEFRCFLRASGYEIIRNEIVREDGKYYFPMKIRFTGNPIGENDGVITASDRYGADLIREDRGLSEYLEYEVESYRNILRKLTESEGEHSARTEEIRELIELNRSVFNGLNKI